MTEVLYKLDLLKNASKELIDSIVLFSAFSSKTKLTCLSALFVTATDNVYAIGNNTYGQLGLGDTKNRTTPCKIPILCGKNISFIKIGVSSSAALTGAGDVIMWGDNTFGQCAFVGTKIVTVPCKVAKLIGKRVIALAGGYVHTMALTDEGEVYTWGDNGVGQLGNGSTTVQVTPCKVEGLIANLKVTQIAAGSSHSLALTDDGIYSWGFNEFGQLGDGTITDHHLPTKVAVLGKTKIKKIDCGLNHCMALDVTGKVYVWGHSYRTQRSYDSSENMMVSTKLLIPTQVKNCLVREHVIDIACVWNTLAAQTSSGVYFWGDLEGICNCPYPTRVDYQNIDCVYLELCQRTCRVYRTKPYKHNVMRELMYKNLLQEKLIDVYINFGGVTSTESKPESVSICTIC